MKYLHDSCEISVWIVIDEHCGLFSMGHSILTDLLQDARGVQHPCEANWNGTVNNESSISIARKSGDNLT